VIQSESDVETLQRLGNTLDLKAVACNRDVTPFAIQRDAQIRCWCQQKGIEFISLEDYTLFPVEKIKTNKGACFDNFTQFYRKAVHMKVPEPTEAPDTDTDTFVTLPDIKVPSYYHTLEDGEGGSSKRQEALDILEGIRRGSCKSYKKQHTIPIVDVSANRLSAYIKYGCVSIREVYAIFKLAAGRASLMVQHLFAREHAYVLANAYPLDILSGQVTESKRNYCIGRRHERSSDSKWNDSDEDYVKWCEGKTGIPLIDAAMTCLNRTGFINAKLRMIVSLFLVKELNIDWKKGERYFATVLEDYDPIINNQLWCWTLSQRRPMNPYKMLGKYDPQAEFVKQWIPDFVAIPVLDIVTWFQTHANYPHLPQPMRNVPGYRVKYRVYIPGYTRPKPQDRIKRKKPSKYAGGIKNKDKYDKDARSRMRNGHCRTAPATQHQHQHQHHHRQQGATSPRQSPCPPAAPPT
jgi:deoxyribodipyrimidine photo-lyase